MTRWRIAAAVDGEMKVVVRVNSDIAMKISHTDELAGSIWEQVLFLIQGRAWERGVVSIWLIFGVGDESKIKNVGSEKQDALHLTWNIRFHHRLEQKNPKILTRCMIIIQLFDQIESDQNLAQAANNGNQGLLPKFLRSRQVWTHKF